MPFTIACSPAPDISQIIMLLIITIIVTIIIEATQSKKFFEKKWNEAFKICTIANIVSSFVGAAFVFLVFRLIFKTQLGGMIILILIWVTIPAIIIWIKNRIYQKYWKDIPKKKLLKKIISINILLYIIFTILIFAIPGEHGRTREKVRRISCFSNLRSIGLSLHQYAMDYNDYFPNEGWEQLRTKYYLTDHGVYICPSSDTPKGKDNEKLTDEMVDYIYQKDLKNTDDAETPLAWDKPEMHEDYGNVLFLDGHVKGFKGEDWMEQAGIKKK